MLIFCSDRAKATRVVGRADRSRDFGCWYAGLVKSNTICPIVEYSTAEEYKQKAGHVIVSPFGSSSIVVPQILHLRKGE